VGKFYMAKTNAKFTLTDFLIQARAVILAVGVCVVLLVIWQIGVGIWEQKQAEREAISPPEMDLAFGRLAITNFPMQASLTKPTSYNLAVPGVSGDGKRGWPVFGNRGVIPVYKLSPLSYSLTADQRSRNIAKNLGFGSEPRMVDERTLLFTKIGTELEENLQVDLKTMFLNLKTNYLATTNVFGVINAQGEKMVPDRIGALKAVRQYLQTAGMLPEDLSDQVATMEYMTSIGSSLQPVQSVLEADYVTVNLPRQPIDGLRDGVLTNYRFFGPDNISSVYAVVGRNRYRQDVVVELADYYYNLDLSQIATYPLQSVATAWAEVANGNGYVFNPRNLSSVVVRSVELGYYETHLEQEYLLPIYVFRGDNGVMIYAQALDSRVF
jgi:hypothetical protein